MSKEMGIWRKYRNLSAQFRKAAPRYLKYQIVTKLIFSVLIMPIFWLCSKLLIKSDGLSALSNSVFLKFLLSPQGILFGVLSLGLIIVGLLLEINGFIRISAQISKGEAESSYFELLKTSLRQLPKMLEYGGVILILYLVVVSPFTGNGIRLSFLDSIKIPNFILSVIESNALYSSFYLLIGIVLLVMSAMWMFTFHFLILGNQKPSQAMKSSRKLVKRNFRRWLKDVLGISLINGVIALSALIVWLLLIVILGESLQFDRNSTRILLSFLLLLQEMSVYLLGMLMVPFEVQLFTRLFYEYVETDKEFIYILDIDTSIKAKQKKSLIDIIFAKKRTIAVLTLVVLVLGASLSGIFFEQIYTSKNKIEIMGHRGGGIEGPENTLAGIATSIKNKAEWAEVDVQRTKDGYYILNHDEDFFRVAGVKRKVADMTYEEIEKLDVGGHFSRAFKGERVPTIDKVLAYCKGKIKLNIELKVKANSLDMARYVIDRVRALNMTREVMITSLDQNLIETIEKKYADIDTGFIYFLAIGDITKIKSDCLILEEGASEEELIDKIHEANKKVIVWTVDDKENMDKFAHMQVDAIITDRVKELREIIDERNKESGRDLMLRMFFEEL